METHPQYAGGTAAKPSAEEAATQDLGRIAMENDSYNGDNYGNGDNVGGYAVPVDPMDLLQSDSCQ